MYSLLPLVLRSAAGLSFQNAILPVVLRMLKDDEADVRLNIISKIDVLSQILGAEQLRYCVPTHFLQMDESAQS